MDILATIHSQESLLSSKIGDILNAFPNSKEFFDKYKIDYCCGGQIKLDKALNELSINNPNVINELFNIVKSNSEVKINKDEIIKTTDFASKSNKETIDFIIKYFHESLRKELPELNDLILKIMRAHIAKHKEIYWKIHELFSKIRVIFESHLILEEENIFKPMLEFDAKKIDEKSEQYRSMISAITEAVNEHSVIGPCLKELRTITNNYTPPQDACNTVKKVYQELSKLEEHIMAHTQLENNVLFPRFTEQ